MILDSYKQKNFMLLFHQLKKIISVISSTNFRVDNFFSFSDPAK